MQREDQEAWTSYARELCLHNYPLFNHLFLGFAVTKHFQRVRQMAVGQSKVLLRLARSFSKSLEFTVGTITHDISYSMVPNSGFEDPRILLMQETLSMAEDTILGLRNVIDSGGPHNLIGATFPSLKSAAVKMTTDKIWISNTGVVSKDPSVVGVGVGGAVTGRHPKKTIGDDLVSKENSKTPHLRNEMWRWWTTSISGTLDPSTEVLLPHTLYYADDLHKRLEATGLYKLIEMPALPRMPTDEDFKPIFDADGKTRAWVELTEKGNELVSLWPCPLGTGNCHPPIPIPVDFDWVTWKKSHFDMQHGGIVHRSTEFLIHEKYLTDTNGFASQFMHILLSSSERRIKPQMVRFFSRDSMDVGRPALEVAPWLSMPDDLPPKQEEYLAQRWIIQPFPTANEIQVAVHAWDHAIGKKKRNDRTALSRNYRTFNNDVFVLFRYGRFSFTEAVKMMSSIYKTDDIFRPSVLVTEGIAFQEAYGETIRENDTEILPVDVETLKDQIDKDTALAESGVLQHMMGGKWFMDIHDKDAYDELTGFPAAPHDDIVDCARIGFNKIKAAVPREAKVYRKPITNRWGQNI